MTDSSKSEWSWLRSRCGTFIKSCTGYRVSKALINGVPKYTAWPPAPPSTPKRGFYRWEDYIPECIDVFGDRESAMGACVKHHEVGTDES